MKGYLLPQKLQLIRNTIFLYEPETKPDLQTKARKFLHLRYETVCQKKLRHLQTLMNLRSLVNSGIDQNVNAVCLCFISNITKISLLKYCIHLDIQVL